MTKISTYEVFVVYENGYPTSLASDDIYTDKKEAEGFAEEFNKTRAKVAPSLKTKYKVTTLDDYIYKRKQDAISEGEDRERESNRD